MASCNDEDDNGFVNDEEIIEQVFDDDVFELVKRIRKKHMVRFRKDLDPNLIFTRLEEFQGHPDRARLVMDDLFSQTTDPQSQSVGTVCDWEKAFEDVVDDDLPDIGSLSPDSDQNFSFPNSPVKVILEDSGQGSPEDIPLIDLEPSQPDPAPSIDFANEETTLMTLRDLIPDADIGFLKSLVLRCKHSLDLNNEVEDLLIHRNYPKKIIVPVRNEPNINPSTSQTPSRTRGEDFYSDLAFTRLIGDFKDYLVEKSKLGESSNSWTRLKSDYVTCQCCYEDEVRSDESEFCIESNHQFCRSCVRKLAEGAVAANLSELKCMASDCSSTFSYETAKRVLKPIVYEKWSHRCQVKEVKMAGLPNFRSCPHCDYGAIIDNPNEKLFYCLNSSCSKVTCLLCKEDCHIPLRCHEVEKLKDVGSRTSREEKMAKAIIRSCPMCNLQFIKEDGCNMLKCACGHRMCYICRQPVENYEHFGNGGCPLETIIIQIPKREKLAEDVPVVKTEAMDDEISDVDDFVMFRDIKEEIESD